MHFDNQWGIRSSSAKADDLQRVVIFVSHPLFGQGVESLLRRQSGLEIVGRETDATTVIEHIRELRPDAVILDSADPACDPMQIVMRILGDSVGTRVIGLNLRDNRMCVYSGEQRMVEQVEDLVDAIRRPGLGGAGELRAPGESCWTAAAKEEQAVS